MRQIRYRLAGLIADTAKKITISLVLLISLLLAGQFAYAAPTTEGHARLAVQRLLASNRSPLKAILGQKIKAVKSYPDPSSPTYFVVELDPSGYIIVSADDTIEPIIAFVEHGSYSPSLDDPLGALVTQDMGSRMAEVKQAAATRARETPERARSHNKWAALTEAALPGEAAAVNPVTTPSDMRVAPLVQSLWSQGKSGGYSNTLTCYNYYTPNNDYCGCVATAMAQLMRYHQYPTTGVGTASFSIKVDNVTSTRALLGGDGAGGPYDWANMPLETRSNAMTLPLAQRQAIGALCADAGVAVSMSYTATSSSAFSNDTKVAMTQTFKYGNAIIGGESNTANNNIMPNLPNMINPNLDAGYPVYFAISGTPGGHAILGDGYGFDSGTAYYHLNMGWSGTSDSWYNLPTIPSALGTFSYLKMCLYNVFPTGSGEIISGRVLDLAGNPISGATVTAAATGGASYPPVTTNAKGIYAFAKLPSNKIFTITAAKAGTPAKTITRTTGTSTDYSYSSGNIWGANITLGGVAIATDSLPAGTVATPYSFTMQATLGTAPYSWSATALPDGLTIDALTGEIHGSPTSAGQTNAIINITDATSTPTSDSVTLPISILSRVATPTFSPAAAGAIGSLGVTISCTTAGATIRYTQDDSDPTDSNGTVYDPAVGIMLFSSATIKAYAFKSGMSDSGIASKSYTISYPPTIASFTPASGITGAVVKITGQYLAGAPAVKFNGADAIFTVVNDTTINATLPFSATSGLISVTTPGGTVSSATPFSVTQSLLLAVSPVSPTATGTPIRLTATPTSTANLEYKFRVKYPDAQGISVWQTVQEYSAKNTCTWAPVEAHTFTIIAYARKVGTTVSYLVYRDQSLLVKPAVSDLRVFLTPVSPTAVGMPVQLSVTPVNGGTMEYRFKVKYLLPDSTYLWQTLQEFSVLSRCTWTPTEAHPYLLYVYAREKGIVNTYSIFKELPFTVNNPVSNVTLATSITSPTGVGTGVKLTATPTSGGVLEYKYFATYLDASAVLQTEAIKDYTTSNIVTWSPKLATSYTITVQCREKGSSVSYDVQQSVPDYVVMPAVTALQLSATPSTTTNVGTPVLLTATPTGGATLEYQFKGKYQVAPGAYSWFTLQTYSPLNSCEWIPSEARSFILYAYARERGTTVAYKVYKEMTYIVAP